MLKYLALLCLVSAVKSEVNTEWFNGRWVGVLEVPRRSSLPRCDQFDLETVPDRHCTCGNETLPVIAFTVVHGREKTHQTPVKIANTSAEAKDALALHCQCPTSILNDILVYRKINENYFVVYVQDLRNQEEYNALLLVKKAPKLSEFRKVFESIDDLSKKEPGYLCEPYFFASEFDDLD